jgi:hypothetical protein
MMMMIVVRIELLNNCYELTSPVTRVTKIIALAYISTFD